MPKSNLLFSALFCLVAAFGCVAPPPPATEVKNAPPVVLVQNRQSKYQIVLPDDYDNPGTKGLLRQAVNCLQREIKAATGVALPIYLESRMKPDRPAIFVGNTRAIRQLGIEPAQFPGLTYLIAERNGNIYLAGRDCHAWHRRTKAWRTQYNLGSVKAIVVFMEKFLQVRFVMPGNIGISTPKLTAITVPRNYTFKRRPPLEFGSGRNQALMYDYANSNYGALNYAVYGGHSYYDAVPAKKYGKTHPEYFALFSGKRVPTGNHLCISNPQVQELIYQEMLSKLNRGAEVVELAQTDGYKPCECANCRNFGHTTDPAEQLWILHRQLAQRLYKEHPDKKVMIINYGATHQLPKTFKDFPPNVVIEICHYEPEIFEQWKNYTGIQGFITYIYNWGNYTMFGFTPKRSPEFCARQVKLFLKNNVKGVYRCGFGELFGLEGPVYYVYGKLFDDPNASLEMLLNEYYEGAFREAAVPMRNFYTTLHRRLEALKGMDRQVMPQNPRVLLGFIYTPELLESMDKNLTAAEKMATDPKVKIRLNLVRQEFEYTKILGEIICIYNAYRLQKDRATFDQLAALIDKRNALINSWFPANGRRTTPLPGLREIRFMGYNTRETLRTNGRLRGVLGAPFTWNTQFLRSQNILPGISRKKMSVTRAVGNVDTWDFNSGAWQNAPYHELNNLQLGKINEKTRFKILYGKTALHLAIESELPDDRAINPVGHDGPTWGADCLEIVLDPWGNREKYFHFIYNPVPESYYDAAFGLITDPLDPRYNSCDPGWHGKWSYQTKRHHNIWYSRFSVPYRTLGVKAPQPGDQWTMNICRESFRLIKHDPELSAWSPNLETMSFHDRESFGEVVFK